MLQKNPQKKGVVVMLRIVTPRKPNSARRAAVKLLLTTKKNTVAFIPGSGHTLKKYSTVFPNKNMKMGARIDQNLQNFRHVNPRQSSF